MAYASFIFVLSLDTAPPLPALFLHYDKVVHLGEYCVLAFLLARALASDPARSVPGWWVPVFIAALYGFVDELHQHFNPPRTFQWSDVASDTVGAVLGVWIYTVMRGKQILTRLL